jgi:hypothetical protein
MINLLLTIAIRVLDAVSDHLLRKDKRDWFNWNGRDEE